MTLPALLTANNAGLSQGWTLRPLSDFCTEIFERCGDKHFTVMSVSKTHGILPQSERFKKRIASDNVSNYKVIKPGFFAYDPMLLWSGSISQHNRREVGVVSPAYCVFNVSSALNPKFLLYFLNAPQRLPFYESISFGTNERRRKAHFKDFCKLQIPYPPLEEQKRIVQILDEAKELRRSRTQADRRTAELIPAIFYEMFGDISTNSKGWPMMPFGNVCECRLGKMLDAKQQTGHHKRPYLRNVNVQWARLELSDVLEMDFDERSREVLRLHMGDVLICEGGEIGRSAIWNNELQECYFQKALHRARPNPKLAVSEFILWSMWFLANTGGLNDFTSQSTIAHLTGERLKVLPLMLPPFPLQQQFAARVAEVRALEENQAASRDRLNDLFQSLLHRAFTGEL